MKIKSNTKIQKKYHLCSFIYSCAELTEDAMKRWKIEIVLSVHHVLCSLQSAVWMNRDTSASMELQNSNLANRNVASAFKINYTVKKDFLLFSFS